MESAQVRAGGNLDDYLSAKERRRAAHQENDKSLMALIRLVPYICLKILKLADFYFPEDIGLILKFMRVRLVRYIKKSVS